MTDKRIDDLVEQGAKAYNEPGATPRDEIWNRIQAARREGTAAMSLKRESLSGAKRLWMWTGAAIAAAAVLALGVSLGRLMERRDTTAQLAAVGSTTGSSVDSSQSQVARIDTPVTRDPRPATEIVRDLRRATDRTAERARQLASVPTPPRRDSAQLGTEALQYRLVLLEHLAGAEAMITAFRTSAHRGAVDAQLAGWSRELLATTRMLESSGASADPVMKRLLVDLDLVLSQIARYASTGTYQPEDLDIIENAITQRSVMPRLRTTIPTT